jgi:TonB-dependent receptor
MDHYQHNDAGEWAGRADAEYKWIDNAFLKSFRFGARYTDKEAITRETGYNWSLLSAQYWLPGGESYITDPGYEGASEEVDFSHFFRGDNPAIPGTWFPSASLVGSGTDSAYAILKASETQGWGWVPLGPEAYLDKTPATDNIAGGLNDQTEKTKAAYALLRFGSDGDGSMPHFDGNIGLRVFQTRNDASGSGLVLGTLSQTATVNACVAEATTRGYSNPADACSALQSALNFVSSPVEDNAVSPKNHYTDWLPSLNLRFFLQEDLFLRLAAGRAIYRPQFYQLNTFAQLGFNFDSFGIPVNYGTPQQQFAFTGTGASPDLKSQKSDQFDASLEYYFGNAGQLSAAVFYKKLSDLILAENTMETFTNADGQSLDFNVLRYVNADKASVKGVELAYQQFYDFLPRPFDGFGLLANLTYVDSNVPNVPLNIFDSSDLNFTTLDLPVEGVS